MVIQSIVPLFQSPVTLDEPVFLKSLLSVVLFVILIAALLRGTIYLFKDEL